MPESEADTLAKIKTRVFAEIAETYCNCEPGLCNLYRSPKGKCRIPEPTPRKNYLDWGPSNAR